jgi:hypothetical protein
MNSRDSLKEKIRVLTPDERTKLTEYAAALKEIKKAIKELLSKKEMSEVGGDMSKNLYLQPEE